MLYRFPRSDLAEGKLRPELLLSRLPGEHDDHLVCMISPQLRREVTGLDDAIGPGDDDFVRSWLNVRSLIRIGHVAVVEQSMFAGAIGSVGDRRVRNNLDVGQAGDEPPHVVGDVGRVEALLAVEPLRTRAHLGDDHAGVQRVDPDAAQLVLALGELRERAQCVLPDAAGAAALARFVAPPADDDSCAGDGQRLCPQT